MIGSTRLASLLFYMAVMDGLADILNPESGSMNPASGVGWFLVDPDPEPPVSWDTLKGFLASLGSVPTLGRIRRPLPEPDR